MEGNAVPRTTESLLILIVDDDIPIGEMLAEVVRELGYTPLVAYNGQQALTLAREHWPALVITDQMMPFLSGTDLIRALHVEATVHNAVPPSIVLMSGVEVLVATDVHVDARLSKPFNLSELERVLHLLCGRASS
jgi:two-component system chemotaxis response regulator CheY